MHVATGDANQACLNAMTGHLNHTGVGACGFGDGLDLIGNLLALSDGGERLVDTFGHVRTKWDDGAFA